MKILLRTMCIYLLQISFLIGGVYFDQKELLNISLFSIWVIIILAFLSLFMDSKNHKIKVKYKLIPRFLAFSLVVSLVALGYFWTASFFAFVWLLAFIKRSLYKDELKRK